MPDRGSPFGDLRTMSTPVRLLLQVVAVALLTVGGIGLYVSVGALLAGDRLAVQTVLTTIAAFSAAALVLRRVLGRRTR